MTATPEQSTIQHHITAARHHRTQPPRQRSRTGSVLAHSPSTTAMLAPPQSGLASTHTAAPQCTALAASRTRSCCINRWRVICRGREALRSLFVERTSVYTKHQCASPPPIKAAAWSHQGAFCAPAAPGLVSPFNRHHTPHSPGARRAAAGAWRRQWWRQQPGAVWCGRCWSGHRGTSLWRLRLATAPPHPGRGGWGSASGSSGWAGMRPLVACVSVAS
jgi:hypothetical protein